MPTQYRRATLYTLIYLLNLADYAVTVYWTSLYGIQAEINPLMRMALVEPLVFAVIKLVLFPILLVWMHHKKYDDSAWMALGMFVVVMAMNMRTVFYVF